MRAVLILGLCAALWSGCSAADGAEDPEALRQRLGQGDPVAGKTKSEAELCQGCHGESGRSTVVGVPSLAGQYAPYIVKQLKDFHSQTRRHRIMNAMAEGLGEADLPDIAAYFAGQARARGEGAAVPQVAKDLFLYGDVDRNIDACAGCHELDARGKVAREVAYPALAGQQAGYLRVQLLNWKAGSRNNSPQGVMSRIAGQLTEDEIVALAEYLSSL